MDSRNEFTCMDRKSRCSINFCFLTLAIFINLISCESSQTGRIIFDEPLEEHSLADARINITQLDNTTKNSNIINLNNDGTFFIENGVEGKPYLIEVLIPGYKIKSEKIILSSSKTIEISVSKIKNDTSQTLELNLSIDNDIGVGNTSLEPPKL